MSFVLLQKSCSIGAGTKILNSHIKVLPGSTLKIGKGCVLNNVKMIVKGNVIIGDNNIFDNSDLYGKLLININKGLFVVGDNNKLQCQIKIRFGGSLTVGNYNNINEHSEIRCDEKVMIGSFNQISYKCMIWDTNTHNIYSDSKRRELTIQHYPIYGYEFEKPNTAKIIIGDDCWLGRDVSILKGVTINNSVIVGYKVLLSNCNIECNTTIVSEINNKVYVRKEV